MNIVQDGAGIQGDHEKFGQFAHLTTQLLEVIREGLHGPPAEDQQAEPDEDHLTGKYVFINPPVWGKTKIFYETSGTALRRLSSFTQQAATAASIME
jgi:hypothetical protein